MCQMHVSNTVTGMLKSLLSKFISKIIPTLLIVFLGQFIYHCNYNTFCNQSQASKKFCHILMVQIQLGHLLNH